MSKTEQVVIAMDKKVEFSAYNKPMEMITMEEAKECLKSIMPSADTLKFEELLLDGMYLGYNDNYFRLRK